MNMQHTVIPSWYQREGYIKAMANLIQNELGKFDFPSQVENLSTSSHYIIFFQFASLCYFHNPLQTFFPEFFFVFISFLRSVSVPLVLNFFSSGRKNF